MLNGDFAESKSIVFEEDCPVALNFVLKALYYKEGFSAYYPEGFTYSVSELRENWWEQYKEVDAILEKYQLLDTLLKNGLVSKVYSEIFFSSTAKRLKSENKVYENDTADVKELSF